MHDPTHTTQNDLDSEHFPSKKTRASFPRRFSGAGAKSFMTSKRLQRKSLKADGTKKKQSTVWDQLN